MFSKSKRKKMSTDNKLNSRVGRIFPSGKGEREKQSSLTSNMSPK